MSSESSTDARSGSPPRESPIEAATRSDLPDRLLVAAVRRPHGVRGDLLFEVLSDVEGRLRVGAELDLVTARGARRRTEILQSRQHSLGVILRLRGVDSREDADVLRGSVLEVDRAEAPPLAEGDYYFHELIGCRCHDRHEGDLGVVREVVEDGGGLLLEVVQESDGAPRVVLLPFVEPYLERVDTAGARIDWKLPEGLLETCASTR